MIQLKNLERSYKTAAGETWVLRRIDLTIPDDVKNSAIARARGDQTRTLGKWAVLNKEGLDGIKFFLDNPECVGKKKAAETWLLLRASGTEPLLRVYCESCSMESVETVLKAAQEFVLKGAA